ncbi:Predicted kinase, aminoglycoside phosphotransferase (APT) family [Thermomonospora echinospora]|uniref:Predicted kinase, aminoglycoside phosphotransferase (APT) family n=1 Tax=Thermomonospora echinospora TaxID=1992 RepID=A0A1H6DPB6_9ACTN|nr:phosphotransferase family protein [Thermomonospora echinospora]SEG86613.1 Predicted kinase, aminoglycoside phosphotransferase (APT) family [Thermomonospora echinospora]
MSGGPAEELASRLEVLAGRPVAVGGLKRLSGGASRETWAFEADGRPLILRLDPPGRPDAPAMAREAGLLMAAAAAGVPVPALVDHGDALRGTPYLIMERLAGETIPRRLLRDERFAAVRPALARELGGILARLHALRPDAVPGLPDGDPLEELAALYESFAEPRPAVELALRWLERNRPDASGGRTVVHGDFRNGNLMVDERGVRGVLDWELAHVGDPWEDLGWLCVKAWRFGSPEPVGGFGPRADLLAGYAEAGGTPPSEEELHWWEVYGTLRWTVLCRNQAERYLSGSDASVEFAVLGRRVCEQEHDLLLSLGLTEPVAVADPLKGLDGSGPAAVPGPHDRPGASSLIDAVSAYLASAEPGDERLRFHNRVAVSALRIARRELLLGDLHWVAQRERLRALGCATDADLALGIRNGRFDDRMDEVVCAVRASVVDKLVVANPRHLSQPA